MFIVLDADALLLVGNDHSIVKGYRRAVLTPNVVEFKRLSEQVVRVLLPTPFRLLWNLNLVSTDEIGN